MILYHGSNIQMSSMSMSFPMVHSITNTSPNTVLNGRSSYGISVTRNVQTSLRMTMMLFMVL